MDIKDVKDYGIDVSLYREFMDKSDAPRCAMDAALVGSPNSAVPAELTTWIDNDIIRVLTAKRSATEILGEVRKGDRTTTTAKFKTGEFTGFTQPYDDYSDNGDSDVNVNYPVRENYLFETVISYGDLESEVSALAKINLASEKQQSAAHTIAVDANKFYFNGVSGLNNYGILNDPSLPAATAAVAGEGGSALWSKKTNIEIYNDVLTSFGRIAARAQGLIDENSKITLALSPASNVLLGQTSTYNQSVLDLLKNYFSNLEIVVAPQYAGSASNSMQMFVDELDGQRTGECAFSEKFIAGRIVPKLSSFKQKFMAGTYGAIIYRPFLTDMTTGI